VSSLQDGLDGLEVCSWCRSSLSQWHLRTRYCHLRSSASAICSDLHSTGSTHPDCNWTMKFRSQRKSHMEPSATSTTVIGPVGERLQASTVSAPVLDHPAPLRRLRDSGAGCRWRFAVNGPATWNRMLPALRSPDQLEIAFEWALKTHRSRPPGAIETSSWFWRWIQISRLTYFTYLCAV